MADLGGQAAFVAAGRTVTWAEVWDAGRRSGRWKALVREVGLGIALRDAGHAPSPEDVRAHGNEFRRRRGLDAAEDAEAWLEARGVTVPAWRDHLLRTVLVRAGAPVKAARAAGTPELEVTGWCSGAFEEMARDVALELLGAGDLALEQHEIARLVERRRLEWIRVVADVAAFPSLDAAREAVQCITSDGLDLLDVARMAKVSLTRVDAFLEDFSPEHRQQLLAGAAGDVVVAAEASCVSVVAVRDKQLPSTGDARVVERAREHLGASNAERLLEQVTWLEPR